MILGTGIDIVNVERIERLISRWGDRFLTRVFTEREIAWCRKRVRFSDCLALRFAAKEAFLKAIGWGYQNGIRWTDIEVRSDPLGKPLFALRGKAQEVMEARKVDQVLLTLSDERPYALAHVILEGKDDESSNRSADAGS
jgi:holo-[acyl-carrier protein] synthase